ncbi:hypothetical protein RF11_01414 [Thelohanellus kitauei]|uniref:CCHC-type domain-containing protein n=1 Tax=Thelohanellus kitauei TaxID=669202 RepID=A0A0C2J1W5_THEKT|nr:hypothetical protein RF11_01414 [Thelohanellus kitauei]
MSSITFGFDSGLNQLPQLAPLSSWECVDRWISKFQLVSEANNLDDTRQSSIMLTLFEEDVLDQYLLSDVRKPAPSKSKLQNIIAFLKSTASGQRSCASSYASFESWKLQPGAKLEAEMKNLLRWISIARPFFTESDREFFVIQKLLNSLPCHVTTQVKLFGDLNLKDTCSKVSLILSSPSVSSINQVQPDVSAVIGPRDTSIKELADAVNSLRLKVDELNTRGIDENPKALDARRRPRKACGKCGLRGHDTHECLGLVTCDICKGKGHSRFICKTKNTSFNYSSSTMSHNGLGLSTVLMSIASPEIQVTALVNTGSSVSLVNSCLLDKQIDNSHLISLRAVNGSFLSVDGSIKLNFSIGTRTYTHDFFAVKDIKHDVILGCDFIQMHDMDIVGAVTDDILSDSDIPNQYQPSLVEVLKTYNHLFSDPKFADGCCKRLQHVIDTTLDRPIAVRPYRVPGNIKNKIRDQINSMLTNGVIRPSSSPWSALVS